MRFFLKNLCSVLFTKKIEECYSVTLFLTNFGAVNNLYEKLQNL